MRAWSLILASGLQPAFGTFLSAVPPSFNETQWAYWSYTEPSLAVLPGDFNRSAFDAPANGKASDNQLSAMYTNLQKTDFVAYDARFFDLIGAQASVRYVQKLAHQSHEAACYIPALESLFFVEWGPPGGDNGTHPWQYMLNMRNNTLRNITTDPPTVNVHGCVYFNNSMHVVTDGTDGETGYLAKVDPVTLRRQKLLNNYYDQPFDGFNDLDMDSDGNFYLTDSKSGAGRDIVPYTNPTNPSTYLVNGETLTPKVIKVTTGNANGVAVSESFGTRIVYLPDTGVSVFKPVSLKDPYGNRGLFAYSISKHSPVLTNERLLNNPISYFYDGVRVSRNGWIFVGAGDGVDVIDPVSGAAMGSIRVGGGENLAVTVAFKEHELWIVGRGGVWHVSDINEQLRRSW